MNIDFPLFFNKLSGAGNDFIFIDNRQMLVPREIQADFAIKVCRHKFSVGADGVMFIEESELADFRWQFYNSDGSLAEMCGNGARCAARFALLNGIVADRKMSFETAAGIIEAEVFADQTVRIKMTPPENYRENLQVELNGRKYEADFLNTGVPHAVVYIDDDIAQVPVKSWGCLVRHHQLFAPKGTNVNFVSRLADDLLAVRTYERGVEDETMACGTGAVAAAICASIKYGMKSPVRIKTSGGELLSIVFDDGGSLEESQPYLQGSARVIYKGELSEEAVLW